MTGMVVEPLKRAAGAVFPYLPGPVRSMLFPQHLAWDRQDLQAIPLVPDAPIRLLFAPANYAAQGYLWAKAASTIPGVAAVNLQYKVPTKMCFPADVSISKAMSTRSHRWSTDASAYILQNFSHVIVEAELPFLGAKYERNVYREVQAMLDAGIKVAFASHGSDLRTPSLHRSLNPYSPFFGPLDGLTETLERSTESNHKLLNHFQLPLFVPTPDILAYTSCATWLPLTVDFEKWSNLPGHDWPRVPRFLHVPSRPALKGTLAIRAVMSELESAGLVEYKELQGLTPAQVMEEISVADVVIDQLTMGLYSTTSVEAMAAGKLVIAEVSAANRDRIRSLTGRECPVIEANPLTLKAVVTGIIENPDSYHQAEGIRYAAAVHGQTAVATALSRFLGTTN